MGDKSEKKIYEFSIFYEESIYMKFQDSSVNGLKVIVGTKKCKARMHARTHKNNMPNQLFFKVGGITNDMICAFVDMHFFIYTQQKSSAQMGFRVNPVLARNSCI